MKTKLLCILHYSPPYHGASMVGDFIKESELLGDNFECRFIKIKSSHTISDIGKINVRKFYYVLELSLKVLWSILIFRPDKIYYTANICGLPFYRDLLLSVQWKVYRRLKNCDIYYHYHIKGINNFVTLKHINLLLTKFFIKDINLILLSQFIEDDFKKVKSYKSVFILPNSVKDSLGDNINNQYFIEKYKNNKTIEILYLSHMMKEKGYWEVLLLANKVKTKNFHFHFAGSWKREDDKNEFFNFVHNNNLEENVTYHGFVTGLDKKELFQKAMLLLYPTKNDNSPLTLLEALSYGVPIIATREGSIPLILDKDSGIVLDSVTDLANGFTLAKSKLINKQTAVYCRKRYIENFTMEKFESNLINILK